MGSFLRLWHYSQFPIYGETGDEWAWTWLGSSLIKTGHPSSWSFFKSYQPKYQISVTEDEGPIVSPALDHPPLFGLAAGLSHALTSTEWQQMPSVKVIRLPLVILGIINLIFLAKLAYKIWPTKPHLANLAILLYATVPTVVFGSRLVVAENLIITWQLLIWLVAINKKTWLRFIFLSLIGALAILTKISGVAIPLSLIGYGVWKKDTQFIWAGVLGIGLGVLCLAGYAAYYNWDLFMAVQLEQSLRNLGLSTVVNRFFLHPTLVKHFFVDGWIVLGLLSLFAFIGKKTLPSSMILVQTTGLASLFFILFSSGEQTFHGWYSYPLIPVFILFGAHWLDELYSDQNWWQLALGWVLFLPTIRMAFSYLAIDQISQIWLRIIGGVGALPLGGSLFFPKIGRGLAKILLVAVIFVNCLVVLSVNDVRYWLDRDFYSKQ